MLSHVILSVPHSGTRSIQKYLAARGERMERQYVQFPTTREKAQAMADVAVLAIRDPALCILSTIERRDDRPSRVMWALDMLYSLRWPDRIYSVDLQSFPHVGKRDYLNKRLYLSGDIEGLEARLVQTPPWSLFGELKKREKIFRPRLEALGYKSLPWWS